MMFALKLWDYSWANKSIQIMCDNIAVVEALTIGRAKDQILATCARNIWLLPAIYNDNVVITHIRGLYKTVRFIV